MVHVDDDASRVQTALDALDNVSAANMTEEDFERYRNAVRNLGDLEESLTDHADCSVEPREGGE